MTDGYGPELVTNGTFDSGSGWTLDTGWTIADGKAEKAAGTGSGAAQSIDLKEGVAYLVSYDVIRAAGGVQAQFTGGATVALASKTASGSALASKTASGSYTDVLVAVSGNTQLRMFASSTFAGSIDNVSVREMPVIKWAPHNLLTYSEDFSNAAWVKGGTVVTANATNAPDGELSADNVVGTSGVGERRVFKSSIVAATVGISYTATVYAKTNGADWLIVRDDFAGYGDTSFDLINGVVGTVASGRTASIYDAGNGYYACSVTSTVTASFVTGQIMFCLADVDNGRATFSGDGIKGIYLWGAHLYRSDLGGMVNKQP
jgi:hypothetical protein